MVGRSPNGIPPKLGEIPFQYILDPFRIRRLLRVVQRVMAAVLLLCFGIMIPVAVAPMRTCFLEKKTHTASFATYGETSTGKVKCCPDCGSTEEGDSCCIEVEKLPDATNPAPPFLLFPVSFCLAPLDLRVPPCPVMELKEPFVPSVPIRGPDLPHDWRALLGVWNI